MEAFVACVGLTLREGSVLIWCLPQSFDQMITHPFRRRGVGIADGPHGFLRSLVLIRNRPQRQAAGGRDSHVGIG